MTIFAIPKPFDEDFGIIQLNAIRSWTHLRPSCEILLFGDEKGTAEVARELRVRHVPSVAQNEFGTPLLNSLFGQAERLASNRLLAYINADVILMSNFMNAVETISHWRSRFLMVGQRQDIGVEEQLRFDPHWEESLLERVIREAKPYSGLEYFVFPRNFWGAIPPFAIGRLRWDRWPVYAARLRKAAVIDATPVVTAVHQTHKTILSERTQIETERNWQLLQEAKSFTAWDTTHVLTPQGIKLRCRSCYPTCICNRESESLAPRADSVRGHDVEHSDWRR